jgi:hypothetical protein
MAIARRSVKYVGVLLPVVLAVSLMVTSARCARHHATYDGAAHNRGLNYELLLKLRRDASKTYAEIPDSVKAPILCSALEQTRTLDAWGYLLPSGGSEGEPAQALMDTGTAALPYLRRLLDNHKPAMLDGAHKGSVLNDYSYRRADFAHRYVCLITGWPHVFHVNIHERDAEIERIRAKLDETR